MGAKDFCDDSVPDPVTNDLVCPSTERARSSHIDKSCGGRDFARRNQAM